MLDRLMYRQLRARYQSGLDAAPVRATGKMVFIRVGTLMIHDLGICRFITEISEARSLEVERNKYN
jgi:hypothetical protein